jgi:type I restriction enzyme, S subunit
MGRSKKGSVRESAPQYRAKDEQCENTLGDKGRVPRLRFPRFSDPWENNKIEPYLEEYGERVSADTELPVYSSTREGLVSQKDYFNGDDVFNDGDYGVVPNGYFVFRHMSDDGTFKFNVNNLGSPIAVSKEYPVFKAVELSTYFLLCLLNDSLAFKHFAFMQKKGGTRTRLYFSTLCQWQTYIPSLPEQQKIAACLSSLDDLIAVHSRKLETLKKYKKGLMQQLFPRQGETVPRHRFPKFRNAGRWVKKPFSDLCDIKHGYAFEGEFFSDEGAYVLLTPGNFYEEGGYRDRGEKQKYYTGEIPGEYVLSSCDLLVAMTEQAVGLLGSPILVPESDKFLHNQRLGLVTKKPGIAWTNEFFFHVFNSKPVRKAIQASASGMKVRHTSPIKIGEVVVAVPDSLPEQRRIAACLSSLDDLIAAQAAKVEALKQHKSGLMQGLFPAFEEGA